MKIKLNNEALAKVHKKIKGGTIEISDNKGVPVDKYWRNRLKDALIDKSIEILKEKRSDKK